MDSCPFCSRPMPRRYENWSREEAAIVVEELRIKKYGASSRAARRLDRDQSQVKAMIDRIARGLDISRLPSEGDYA
jgi:hypothetical protein